MGRGVLALLSFCQNCLSLVTVLFVGFAYLCSQHFLLDLLAFGATPHICYQTGRLLVGASPPLFVTRAAGPFICYYIYYIIALFVGFTCLCSQHFLLDLLRLCSQHFLLILIPLFIALFVGFACVCSQHFLRVFFVILYNKKEQPQPLFLFVIAQVF